LQQSKQYEYTSAEQRHFIQSNQKMSVISDFTHVFSSTLTWENTDISLHRATGP